MRRLAWFVIVLLVAACASDANDATTTATLDVDVSSSSTTATRPSTTSPSTTSPAGDPSPDDPVDERLSFLTDLLNGAGLSEEEYGGAFTSDFVENVPYEEFTTSIDQIASTGSDWAVGEYEERSDLSATAVIAPAGGGEAVRARMSLESSVPYRIEGLLLQPAEPPTLDDPPADLEEGADRLAELGTERVVAAEVTGGTCAPLFERRGEEPAPIGSAFKLYVLGAVADQVASGTLAWDDEIAIDDDLKSVPTGTLQNEEAGTEFSVREMSEAMIALSDNTATDHLIAEVGRPAVEEAFGDYGMSDPGPNIPLLNTLELTALKVGPASGLATQWVDADDEGRRGIIDQISDLTPADIPVAEFDHPIRPDEIEWFASPVDLCRAHLALDALGEPVTDILSINPGVPAPEGAFESIAFKGGSEPGLVAMSWLVERPDGRRFVLAGSVVEPEESLDQLEATLLFVAMRDLLADL